MSNSQNPHDHDSPRFEPWIGVIGLSIVPVVVGVNVSAIVIPMIALSVILFAASLVMLWRQNKRRSLNTPPAPPGISTSSVTTENTLPLKRSCRARTR